MHTVEGISEHIKVIFVVLPLSLGVLVVLETYNPNTPVFPSVTSRLLRNFRLAVEFTHSKSDTLNQSTDDRR